MSTGIGLRKGVRERVGETLLCPAWNLRLRGAGDQARDAGGGGEHGGQNKDLGRVSVLGGIYSLSSAGKHSASRTKAQSPYDLLSSQHTPKLERLTLVERSLRNGLTPEKWATLCRERLEMIERGETKAEDFE